MPKYLRRYQNTGDLHFLTFSCHGRRPYLEPATRDLFEHSLERIRNRFGVILYGYVVMPEHIHMLVAEPRERSLATFLQALKLSVARQSRERPFWQRRYYDFNVYTELKQREKLRYLHRNPVMRGLVAAPEAWRWSSFHHYLTGEAGVLHVESPWIANSHAGWTPTSQTRDVGHPRPADR